MKILGVLFQSSHDSGVALLDEDRILYAANEERFDRVKMSNAFPDRSWDDCLRYTGTKPEEIDLVVYSGFPPSRALAVSASFKRKSLAMKYGGSEAFAVLRNPLRSINMDMFSGYMGKYRRFKEKLKGYRAEVLCAPHHLTHGHAAYYTGGTDDPLVLCVEGFGGNETTSYMLRGEKGLAIEHCDEWPHSVGRYYSGLTQMLGFISGRHEGKITGLAAYGDPKRAYEVVKRLLWCDGLSMRVGPEVFAFTSQWRKLKRKLPPPLDKYSREDLAAAWQQRLEDVVCEWAANVLARTGKREVALTGGVFANVKLNQRIHELPGVRRVMVHPGMGDMGCALGAALAGREAASLRSGKLPAPLALPHVYLGPDFSEAEMEAAIRAAGLAFERRDDVERKVAEAIHAGKVVARFDGRMEYGPRALGARSMLYHAKDRSVNEWLNKKLKRTEFMPFAPACTYEARDRLFKNVGGAEQAAEFMTVTFDATEEMAERGAAAVHVDNTARPQLVREGANPSFHRIISEYEKLSGFPCVINTSFNMHEEPIVCTPEDGVKGFVDSQVDVLAMGPFLARIP